MAFHCSYNKERTINRNYVWVAPTYLYIIILTCSSFPFYFGVKMEQVQSGGENSVIRDTGSQAGKSLMVNRTAAQFYVASSLAIQQNFLLRPSLGWTLLTFQSRITYISSQCDKLEKIQKRHMSNEVPEILVPFVLKTYLLLGQYLLHKDTHNIFL